MSGKDDMHGNSVKNLEYVFDNLDYSSAKLLLAEDPSLVHAEMVDGWTVFERLALTDVEALQIMLEAGANPLWKDSSGRNVLSWINGDTLPECIHMLIEAGANMEACDDEGRRPLIISIEENNPEVTFTLIELGADMEAIKPDFEKLNLNNEAAAVYKSIDAKNMAISILKNDLRQNL